MGRTVVARLVATLEAHDLVRRTADGVDLGFGLVGLADQVSRTVREAARPHMQRLAAVFNETVVLAVVDGDDAVAVDQVVPEGRVVRVHYHPGTRHPLAVAAHGRAMLAHLDRATVARVTGDDPDLAAELEHIRARGHATSHDELEDGVAGLAAAVLGDGGLAVAALGVVAPAGRLPVGDLLVAALVEAAAEVGRHVSDPGRPTPVPVLVPATSEE